MVKRFILIQFILVISLMIVSCTSDNAKKPSDGPNVMKPTDEYNYILSPASWNTALKDFYSVAFGVQESEMPQDFEFMKSAGFGEPKIEGLSDGEKIELKASYPILDEKIDFAKVYSNLPADRIGFAGRVKPERLIAYMKFPGFEGLVEAIHDYYEVLIEKGESPTGKSNPVTAAMGILMMAQVDYKEDLFAWMGSEMGLVMYGAMDKDQSEYLNTAFVMAIKDKDKAGERINKLLKIGMKYAQIDESQELFKREIYKSYAIDTFEIPALNSLYLEVPPGIIPSEGLTMGILYTDEYLFVSDLYGVKQLADIYEPGGAQGEASTVMAFMDWDKFVNMTSRYQTSYIEMFRKSFQEQPEKLQKFEEYNLQFQDLKRDKTFGQVKMKLNMTENDLQIELSLTKSLIEHYEFMNKWLKDMLKQEEEVIKTQAPENVK